jgi:hypothetical protein
LTSVLDCSMMMTTCELSSGTLFLFRSVPEKYDKVLVPEKENIFILVLEKPRFSFNTQSTDLLKLPKR